MIKNKFRHKINIEEFLLFLLIIVFVIIEIPYINRPLYWDEAWSYGPAVDAMYRHGPSLMPTSISAWLSRGHPLFFYFISSLWMTIFGNNMIAIHLFFILISILLIVFVFKTTTFVNNKKAGIFASIIIVSIPLFLSQATFLLPEMLIALLSTMYVYYYLKQKLVFELITASLLVLTKETGIIIVFSILLYHFISGLVKIKSSKEIKSIIFSTVLHSIPVFVAISFFFIQKLTRGWFFYPEHLGMLTFNITDFIGKLDLIFKYIFVNEGRFILSFTSLIAVTWLFCKNKFRQKELNYFILGTIILIFYSLFSALNFFTLRYLLAIIPIFSIIAGILINKLFKNKIYLSIIVIFLFSLISVFFTIKSNGNGDNTLSYKNMITANKKIIDFCEEQNLYNDKIYSNFLMKYNLQNTFLNYLNSDKTFTIVDDFNDADYIIVSSNENYPNKDMVKDTNKFKLLKSVIINQSSWCEIYKRK